MMLAATLCLIISSFKPLKQFPLIVIAFAMQEFNLEVNDRRIVCCLRVIIKGVPSKNTFICCNTVLKT